MKFNNFETNYMQPFLPKNYPESRSRYKKNKTIDRDDKNFTHSIEYRFDSRIFAVIDNSWFDRKAARSSCIISRAHCRPFDCHCPQISARSLCSRATDTFPPTYPRFVDKVAAIVALRATPLIAPSSAQESDLVTEFPLRLSFPSLSN